MITRFTRGENADIIRVGPLVLHLNTLESTKKRNRIRRALREAKGHILAGRTDIMKVTDLDALYYICQKVEQGKKVLIT